MTRRLFLRSLSAAALAIAGLHLRPRWKRRTSSDGDPWTAARQIVESGALGPVIWGQVTTSSMPPFTDRELQAMLGAMGVRERPRRITTLTAAPGASSVVADATTILEFASDPPVYLAPGRRPGWTIRGTRGRLQVSANHVQVFPCQA